MTGLKKILFQVGFPLIFVGLCLIVGSIVLVANLPQQMQTVGTEGRTYLSAISACIVFIFAEFLKFGGAAVLISLFIRTDRQVV